MSRLHDSSLQDRSETALNPLGLPEIPAPPSQDSATLLDLLMRATSGTTTTKSLRWNQNDNRFVRSEDDGRLLGVQRRTASL